MSYERQHHPEGIVLALYILSPTLRGLDMKLATTPVELDKILPEGKILP